MKLGKSGITYEVAATSLISSEDPRARAIGYWALARCSPLVLSKIKLNGKKTFRTELLVLSIESDNTLACAFADLASANFAHTVTLFGRVYSNLRLLAEALRLDPNHAEAYHALSQEKMAWTTGAITLPFPDERTFTREQLLIQTIRCDPNHAGAFRELARLIGRDGLARLADGRRLNGRQLCVEAIRCDASDADMYNLLGELLGPSETAVLADGRELSCTQLFLEALRCKPGSRAYCNLSRLAALSDRHTMDLRTALLGPSAEQQLLLEAQAVNPFAADSYVQLAGSLAASESITLRNGETAHALSLLGNAVLMSPESPAALRQLAARMQPDDVIQLPSGHRCTKDSLLGEAAALELQLRGPPLKD